MLRKWAMRATSQRTPGFVLWMGVIVIGVQAAVLQWRSSAAVAGLLLGFLVAGLVGELRSRALRDIIDEQSQLLTGTGQQPFPRARIATWRDHLKFTLLFCLFLGIAVLLSR